MNSPDVLLTTVKIAGLYLIPIKSYSKNTQLHYILKWILVATENLIAIIRCNEKQFFDINSMINYSLIQNHQQRYALGEGTQLNHSFLWKFLSLLNPILFIGISTTYCPYPITLTVIDTINPYSTLSQRIPRESTRKRHWRITTGIP